MTFNASLGACAKPFEHLLGIYSKSTKRTGSAGGNPAFPPIFNGRRDTIKLCLALRLAYPIFADNAGKIRGPRQVMSWKNRVPAASNRRPLISLTKSRQKNQGTLQLTKNN